MSSNFDAVIPTLYEALDIVSRELVGFIPAVSRDSTADRAGKDQVVSSHIVPAITTEDITPGDNPANSGDVTVGNVDITISKAKAAPVRWTGEEQRSVGHSGQLPSVQTQRFAQAMRALVNEVETDVGAEYHRASRAFGTAGTAPFGSNLEDVAETLKILKDNGAPREDLQLLIDTSAGVNLRSLTQLTNVNQAGAQDTLRQGVLLPLMGFDIRESAGVASHSAGTSSTVVDGAHAEGATEIAITTGAVDLSAGDVISFGGDHKYVVAADIDSVANDIQINEPGLQEALSGGETVIVESNYAANLAFSRSAIHLVTRAPAMPDGGDGADDVMEIQDDVSGLAFQVAMYRQYRRVKFEVGLAWGVKAVKSEHMALLLG